MSRSSRQCVGRALPSLSPAAANSSNDERERVGLFSVSHVHLLSPCFQENITADAIGQLQRFDFDILRNMLSWGYPTGIERAVSCCRLFWLV